MKQCVTETKRQIRLVIERKKSFIASQTDPEWKGRENPLVIASVREAQGQLSAYENVLAALEHDAWYLKLDAGLL